MVDLKPCPFCGSSPKIQRDVRFPRPECKPMISFEVFCENYECIIYRADNTYYPSEKEAVDAWNRRTTAE